MYIFSSIEGWMDVFRIWCVPPWIEDYCCTSRILLGSLPCLRKILFSGFCLRGFTFVVCVCMQDEIVAAVAFVAQYCRKLPPR